MIIGLAWAVSILKAYVKDKHFGSGCLEMSEVYEKDKYFGKDCLEILNIYEKDKHFEAYETMVIILVRW